MTNTNFIAAFLESSGSPKEGRPRLRVSECAGLGSGGSIIGGRDGLPERVSARLGWLRRSQFQQQAIGLSLEVARLGDQILHLAANRWTAFNSGASCEGVRLVAQVVRFPFAFMYFSHDRSRT